MLAGIIRMDEITSFRLTPEYRHREYGVQVQLTELPSELAYFDY